MNIRIIPLTLIVLALSSLLFGSRSEPAHTPTPVSSPALKVSSTLYRHFNNAFSTFLPEGWHFTEGDEGVVVSEPNGGALFSLLLVNTGNVLDTKAIQVYVDSVEANYFATFRNYKVMERSKGQNCVKVGKTLESKGVAKKVLSEYCYRDGVMSQQDLWMDANRAEAYSNLYETVTRSLTIDTKVVKTFKIYREQFVFAESRKRFEFKVPYSWKHETVEGVEKFTSPDEVNALWYAATPGDERLKWLGGQFADVGITEDRVQKDGSRRVAWSSVAGGVKGLAVITSVGRLAWMVKSDEFEKFASFGDGLLSNYRVVK